MELQGKVRAVCGNVVFAEKKSMHLGGTQQNISTNVNNYSLLIAKMKEKRHKHQMLNTILKFFGLHWTEGLGLVTYQEWKEAEILSEYLDILIHCYDMPVVEFLKSKYPYETHNEKLVDLLSTTYWLRVESKKDPVLEIRKRIFNEGYFDDEIERIEEDNRSFCPICHQETYECVCGK